MLNIFYGDMDNSIYNTSVYFKNVFRSEWLDDDFIKKMIQDVDSSTVLGNGAIDSPYLGVISPDRLSGGVKTLILIYKVPDKIFNASNCGDNCSKWLLKIGEKRDVTINLRHYMKFDDSFVVNVLNDDIVIKDSDKLLMIADKYI